MIEVSSESNRIKTIQVINDVRNADVNITPHENRIVHCVQPFYNHDTEQRIENDFHLYNGQYMLELGPIPHGLNTHNLAMNPGLYSDGTKYYKPSITFKHLRRMGGTNPIVYFMISSHIPADEVCSVAPNQPVLPPGLYSLSEVNETESQRSEIYTLLRDSPPAGQRIQVYSPAAFVPYIPGYPLYPIKDAPKLPAMYTSLRNAMDVGRNNTLTSPRFHSGNNRVIVYGSARNGKDTMCIYLSGYDLIAESPDEISWVFRPVITPIPDCDLSIIEGVTGSKLGSCLGRNDRVPYWSCPGCEGLEDTSDDATNVASIKSLFSIHRPFKLVLTIVYCMLLAEPSYQDLSQQLDRFVDTFGEDACFKSSILVVTKYADHRPVKAYLDRILGIYKNNANMYPTKAIRLLSHYCDDDLIHTFPVPTVTGPYPEEYRDVILKGLCKFDNASHDVPPVSIRPRMSRRTYESLDALSRDMILDISSYLKTSITQAIYNRAKQLCTTHDSTSTALRQKLTATFRTIPINASMTEFINSISTILGDTDVNFQIVGLYEDGLQYMQTNSNVNPDSTRLSTWIGFADKAIHDVIGVTGLQSAPGFLQNENILTITGSIVGISDVVNRIQPEVTEIRIMADVFVLDSDLTCRGGLVTVFAPVWVCRSAWIDGTDTVNATPVHINLRGKDGSEGSPGGMGGRFIGQGRHFHHMDGERSLKIDTSGGRGGNGAVGIDGAAGENGQDATALPMTPTLQPLYVNACVYVDGLYHSIPGDIPHDGIRGHVSVGGNRNCYDFKTDERIIRIHGKSGDVIDCICFDVINTKTLEIKTYFTCGGSGGAPFEWKRDFCEVQITNILLDKYGSGRTLVVKHIEHQFIERFKDDQTPGQRGANGGDSGPGGYGGFPGYVIIKGGCNWTQREEDRVRGVDGEPGRPGLGGNGGKHGRPFRWYSHADHPVGQSHAARGIDGNLPNPLVTPVPDEVTNAQPTELQKEAEFDAARRRFVEWHIARARNPDYSHITMVFPGVYSSQAQML